LTRREERTGICQIGQENSLSVCGEDGILGELEGERVENSVRSCERFKVDLEASISELLKGVTQTIQENLLRNAARVKEHFLKLLHAHLHGTNFVYQGRLLLQKLRPEKEDSLVQVLPVRERGIRPRMSASLLICISPNLSSRAVPI
jgi:hypothetical protein